MQHPQHIHAPSLLFKHKFRISDTGDVVDCPQCTLGRWSVVRKWSCTILTFHNSVRMVWRLGYSRMQCMFALSADAPHESLGDTRRTPIHSILPGYKGRVMDLRITHKNRKKTRHSAYHLSHNLRVDCSSKENCCSLRRIQSECYRSDGLHAHQM
ncbi:hypothetical protein BJ165DRAFT_619253 [Panaeolus papilionaceus]|nr:hypothetical protein BJ165DRAFT_619253 [Panaeolus papilionaceus]